jgi:hypothetical protein
MSQQRRRQLCWPGETVRLRAPFVDETGAPVTVSGVEFLARDPAGAVVSLTPQQESPSTYYADMVVTLPGDYAVRATCAAPTSAADEKLFSVVPSNVI